MAVAADYHVDVARVLGKGHVVDVVAHLVAYVGDGHHGVAVLDVLEPPCGGVGGLDGVGVFHAVVCAYARQAFGVAVDADEAYAAPVHFFYGVGLEELADGARAAHVVVRGDELGVGHAHPVADAVDAVVKLVVAEDAYVVAERVEHALLHLASEKGEEEAALHCVAGVDEQHMRLGGAHTVNHHLAACHASEVVVVEGVDLRVGVVGVEQN